ncbi:MAG: hypothetical protein QM504_00875 [Pseudomonadota bacterium]
MIISDSTAIITLININEFELLKRFTKKLILVKEVYDEISLEENAKKFLDAEIESNYVIIQNCNNRILFDEINILLDDGEAASIALAIEKKQPLIIDEKKGRKFAKNLGVEIIGLIGIIRFLHLDNRIDKKQTLKLIDKLNDSDFRISDSLLDMILNK